MSTNTAEIEAEEIEKIEEEFIGIGETGLDEDDYTSSTIARIAQKFRLRDDQDRAASVEISLYESAEDDVYFYMCDDGDFTDSKEVYQLSDCPSQPKKFLQEKIAELIERDPNNLAVYAWGQQDISMDSIEGEDVDEMDGEKPCRCRVAELIQKDGYRLLKFVDEATREDLEEEGEDESDYWGVGYTSNRDGDWVIFPTRRAAQDWIDRQRQNPWAAREFYLLELEE